MEKTTAFLKALKTNNNKDWFDKHKDQYLEAKDEFEQLVGKVIGRISKFDKQIGDTLQPKDCMFRIYRDVRFSKDKTPYKTHFSADINPGGRKSMIPGYYFQIKPGGSFLAGGAWMPMPDKLAAIRQEIDYNGKTLEKILNAASYKKFFSGLDDSDKLKTVPKGFDKEHKYIETLKLKSFLAYHEFSDKIAKAKDPDKYIAEGLKAMYPLVSFLREAME
ncbi:MAG: DUF2461 domain-containing protein [Bacteroidia bacterium]